MKKNVKRDLNLIVKNLSEDPIVTQKREKIIFLIKKDSTLSNSGQRHSFSSAFRFLPK